MFSLSLKEGQKKEEVSLWHSPDHSRDIKRGCLVTNMKRIFTLSHLSLAPPPTQNSFKSALDTSCLRFSCWEDAFLNPRTPSIFKRLCISFWPYPHVRSAFILIPESQMDLYSLGTIKSLCIFLAVSIHCWPSNLAHGCHNLQSSGLFDTKGHSLYYKQ